MTSVPGGRVRILPARPEQGAAAVSGLLVARRYPRNCITLWKYASQGCGRLMGNDFAGLIKTIKGRFL
jgi:hypothetical protein